MLAAGEYLRPELFLAAVYFAGAFLAADVLAGVFFAAVFFAAVFFAAVLLLAVFVAIIVSLIGCADLPYLRLRRYSSSQSTMPVARIAPTVVNPCLVGAERWYNLPFCQAL